MRSGYGALTGVVASPAGSTAVDSIDVTGSAAIDRSGNGAPDIFGRLAIISANPSETIAKIENDTRLMPLKIVPDAALQLTIDTVVVGALANNGEIVSGYGSVTLYGSKGDYMVVEPITAGGYDVYQVTAIINN